MVKPLSSKKRSSAVANGIVAVLLGLFMVGGLTGFWFLFVSPICHIVAAKSWTAVPCTILSSAVGVHRGSKGGSTYSIDISYRYRIDNRDYTAERYSFVGGSSSGRASKQAVVDQLPVGSQAVCYVDPADPASAVLERGWDNQQWFGLVPLVFFVFGVFGLWGVLRGRNLATVPADDDPVATEEGDGLELRPTSSPVTKVVAAVVVALFWNGIVAFPATSMISGWQRGQGEWLLTIFLIPFAIVGLVMIGAAVYYLLALANPRVCLRLARRTLRLGQSSEIEWELSGRVRAVTRLQLVLEGCEKATYRAGKNNRTDTSVFVRQVLAEVADGPELAAGRAAFAIPAGAMHTFNGENNTIAWMLTVHGEIPHWPDVKDEYPLIVSPAGKSGGRQSDSNEAQAS